MSGAGGRINENPSWGWTALLGKLVRQREFFAPGPRYAAPPRGDFMLPSNVMSFLDDAAKQARTEIPDRNSSLFLSGLLDSFSLVDFVSLVENECDIKVSDTDLRPENFDTIAKVEEFIAQARAAR